MVLGEALFDLSKMDPMARRCVASVEAMQKAIDLNNRDDVAAHLEAATNALKALTEDLVLHDTLVKALSNSHMASDEIRKGVTYTPQNTEGNFNGGEDAIAYGVVRPGRSDKLYRKHQVF
jgi:hypothetical protein